jgi:hypothetical protein
MQENRPHIQTFEPARALVSAGELFVGICHYSDICRTLLCGSCRVANSDLFEVTNSLHPKYQATREWAKGRELVCRFTQPTISNHEDLVLMWVGPRVYFGNISSLRERMPQELSSVREIIEKITY